MNILTELGYFFTDPLMQRSLIAAVIVGVAAPIMGTYLVQRKLSLLGDGIGHVALTGVALGWIVGAGMGLVERDALAIPGAVVAAVIGAVAIEFVRERGKTSGDVALALLFYSGIAGGVVLIGLAGGTNANLMAYLFGSISTVTTLDLFMIAALGVVIIAVGVGMRSLLFTISNDEEFARASGLPVRAANIVIAVIAALTVTVSMRVVGLLLVSAIMILPVAVAQLMTASFRTTMRVAMIVGVIVTVGGLMITYWVPLSPGATIVMLAVLAYTLVAILKPLFATKNGRGHDPHPDVPDDVALEGAQGALTKEGASCNE
ncbi:metal ABC transporter permease [Timonella senegalensis]|uniref:metal ABC transporter permease n=1 Tax=Timonella senegalensis TaxID=1465825 RepID=UPI0028ADC442|nr:metal ABC transporter permease [Timonella senegalensis]